ncbi:hypothetical protein D3C81_1681460 [compost metagenome]
MLRGFTTVGKAFGPQWLADLAVLVIPETLKHIRVVKQDANTARELGPHQIFDQAVLVQGTEFFEKCLKGGLFGQAELFINVRRVCRVEGDPQKDKASINIISLLSAVQPAQCSMSTQGEVGVMALTFLAVSGLECLMVHEVMILEGARGP